MRIELLLEELVQTQRQQGEYRGAFKAGKSSGMGTQAKAKPDRNDPHMVTKHNFKPFVADRNSMTATWDTRKDDGFHRFASFLIKHKLMGENPHMPRVYNIKTLTDADGRHIHTYTVEKLIDYYEVSKEELLAFIENHLQPDTIYIDPSLKEEDWVVGVFKRIALRLDRCIGMDSEMNQVINSESLVEAIGIIRKAKSVLGEPSDMHEGNFMWRRGPQGLTLVFNDPFY